MILHLYQAIPYIFTTSVTKGTGEDITTAYDGLLRELDQASAGSEACLACAYTRTEDMIRFTVMQTGWANPPDDVMRQAVREGAVLPAPAKEETAFTIPANDYRFTQLPWTPEGASLTMTLLPFFAAPAGTGDNGGIFFLRMIKENMLEVVVQVMTPLA